MIHELRIRALGVIDEAVIPFAPGLTVLTGETGAGKTMVLTGLGLIRGEKADAGLVRTGAAHADVDGEWRLPADAQDGLGARRAARLEEAGGACEADGGELVLLLGRSIAAGGRSRAFAGGRTVPAATLAELDRVPHRRARPGRPAADPGAAPSARPPRPVRGREVPALRQRLRRATSLRGARRRATCATSSSTDRIASARRPSCATASTRSRLSAGARGGRGAEGAGDRPRARDGPRRRRRRSACR